MNILKAGNCYFNNMYVLIICWFLCLADILVYLYIKYQWYIIQYSNPYHSMCQTTTALPDTITVRYRQGLGFLSLQNVMYNIYHHINYSLFCFLIKRFVYYRLPKNDNLLNHNSSLVFCITASKRQ